MNRLASRSTPCSRVLTRSTHVSMTLIPAPTFAGLLIRRSLTTFSHRHRGYASIDTDKRGEDPPDAGAATFKKAHKSALPTSQQPLLPRHLQAQPSPRPRRPEAIPPIETFPVRVPRRRSQRPVFVYQRHDRRRQGRRRQGGQAGGGGGRRACGEREG
ncbi:hypothetical protein BJV74DRAFT_146923 [Russula compacta]|nr:hypothetical protein BJV74DRAFT_146923 [Russula compacta]